MKILWLILISLLFACTADKKNLQNSKLKLALSTEIPTIDPAIAFDTVSAKVLGQIYETLFEYEYLKRPLTLRPLIAKEFPLIENKGLKYTIKLKDNILYHQHKLLAPGRSVTAQDFINQIKRLAFKKTQGNGWWLFENKIKGLDSFRNKAKTIDDLISMEVEGLKAPDKSTLIIHLKKPFPQLMYAFALTLTAPIPVEVIKEKNNQILDEAFGTGPYKIKKWQRGSKITLEKNKQYITSKYPKMGDRFSQLNGLLVDQDKALPFFNEIEFRVIKEAQTRWLEFLNSNLDSLVLAKDHFNLAFDENGNLNKELKKLKVNSELASAMTYWWLGINMKDPILGNNKNLRMAIAHAINRDEFIKIFTNNIGLKANYFLPPDINGYNPSYDLPYKYDLKKASEYLKKAGYPNGKGLQSIKLDMRGSNTTARQMANFFKTNLEKIGIKVEINLNQFAAFLKKARSGNLELFLDGWALDYPDAENVLQLLLKKNHPPGQNSTYYHNRTVEKFFNEYMTSSELEIPIILKQIQKELDQDLPWIMLYYARNTVLYSNKLVNYRYHPMYNWFKYVKPNSN